MDIVRTTTELVARIADWREDGEQINLVPTMGGLHAGHTRLIRAANEREGKTVLSIFVNPTQFGPGEDLTTYPRAEADDLELARIEFVDLAFVPDVTEMYPHGFSTRVPCRLRRGSVVRCRAARSFRRRGQVVTSC